MIDFERDNEAQRAVARIKVLGIGGGGSNMVNSMIESGYSSSEEGFDTIDFMVANTDAQALSLSKVSPSKRIQLGVKLTKGLGAGADPTVGKRAAEEDIDSVLRLVKGADVVFLTAGLGGGTGSGAIPIIARALKEKDILTIAVVTKPFMFEGKRRMKVAQEALELLHEQVDTLIVIPNQKLIEEVDQRVSLINAFSMINGIPNQFIKSIADIIARPGHINVDFADVKTIMKQRGYAVIGTGRATGDDRALKAARQAVTSRLLDNASIGGARGVLLNISGSSNLGLHELSAAASVVYEQAHEDASIILGSVIDESLGDDVTVTVIATGFSYAAHMQEILSQPIPQPVVSQEPVQPARTVNETQPSVAPKEEPVDMNDLEIPAIMRKMLQR